MDPKSLTVDKFMGGKKSFDDRRKTVELYISRFFPEADLILKGMRRCSIPVSEDDFNEAAEAAEVTVESLTWSFHQLQSDAGKWVRTKLGPEPMGSTAAVGEGFISIYCQLN